MSKNYKSNVPMKNFIEKSAPVLEEEEVAVESVEEVVEQPIVEEKVAAAFEIKHVKDNTKLRVRRSPELADNVIGELHSGNEVKVYELKNGWAKISADKNEYVMADFLK